MIELYFNDANLLPCFYDAPLHKGLLYHLNDGTTLRIRPVLNEAGEPELLIRCVTEETVEEMYQRVSNYDKEKEL